MTGWFVFGAAGIIAVALGLFLLLRPQGAIELQRRFYAGINWRIEPIDMRKEIYHTRIMGAGLCVFALLLLGYLALRGA